MHMSVNTARRQNLTFTRYNFGTRANDDIDIRLGIRVTSFSDSSDTAIFQTDIGFHDTPPVDNDGIGNDGIHHGVITTLTLTHTITNHLATTEHDFFTIMRVVFFYLDPQLSIA